MTDSTFFGFEEDFVESLRCIPMAVRMRLDVTGVKLKLNEWSRLDQAERMALAIAPCASPEEISAYRDDIRLKVERATGNRPSMLSELPNPLWDDAFRIPEQVADQARAQGLEVDPAAWAGLRPLQRFALVKLSRPGHENRNFLPAMREFGLAG